MSKGKVISVSLFFLLIVNACGKKTEVMGKVYSKNSIPIPNASIDLYKYGESTYPEISPAKTTTNNKGEYYFSFDAKKKWRYEVHSYVKDSGEAKIRVEKGIANTIDIRLY